MSLRTVPEALHVIINGTGGTIAAVAAVALQRVGIYRMILVIGSPAVSVTIQDTAGGALSAPYPLAANGSITIDTPINGDPWWQSSIGLGIQIFQSGTTQISADLFYLQGP